MVVPEAFFDKEQVPIADGEHRGSCRVMVAEHNTYSTWKVKSCFNVFYGIGDK